MATTFTLLITMVTVMAASSFVQSNRTESHPLQRSQTTAANIKTTDDPTLLAKYKKNIFKKAFQKLQRNQDDGLLTETGSTRALPVLAAAGGQIQGAMIEKGIEVAGKLIDKQLQNIEQAQEKAADFLKKKIKLDITPGKGWQTTDMLMPPEYHINAEMEGDSKTSEADQNKKGAKIDTYAHGIGGVIMNGCWGTGYQKGDPCYSALKTTDACINMIDGAAFIGVGFDGRGTYSPESRKMSIIQRNCAGKSSYDGDQVPDTMNVHGIYDTSALMTVFSSREEYRKYLQKEAGVSGSVLGFYSGVKQAWGSSESTTKQMNLAVFDIDVDRYEIFKDEVKPQDLSRSFLREFINLPNEYFSPGAPVKFQDFILRWGTHYIKSAKFGGQLEIRKLQTAEQTASKEEFAEESEAGFKSLFFSGGARSSTNQGTENKSQKNYMSTSVVVQGGSQEIAAIISDLYSPTFKSEVKNWLESIPTYPKAFKFLMGPITDLLDFRVNDLFPEEEIKWECELQENDLKKDEDSGKYYFVQRVNDKDIKRYCEFGSPNEMAHKLQRKLQSLKRAIEIYMEEGSISVSDISLPGGETGCETDDRYVLIRTENIPTWDNITVTEDGNPPPEFRVTFDLKKDLKKKNQSNSTMDIPKAMSRLVKYRYKKWFTADKNGEYRLYDGFSNGASETLENNKISIFGLVLKYHKDGSLKLEPNDLKPSKDYFPNLEQSLVIEQFAQISWPPEQIFLKATKTKESITHLPCNVKWSNVLRINPSDREGKCIHFTASSKGPLYVALAEIPSKQEMQYYVEISPYGIAIYKAKKMKVSTVDSNALALGDAFLYQSYFVCITESEKSTVIEYGKSQDATGSRDVYLTMIDHNEPLRARFFSFANGEYPAQVMDVHIIARDKLETTCKGVTHKDLKMPNCVQKCHQACDPFQGCRSASGGEPQASECNECRFARITSSDICTLQCPEKNEFAKGKVCKATFDLTIKKPGFTRSLGNSNDLKAFTFSFWFQVLEPQKLSDVAYIFRIFEINNHDGAFFKTYLKKNDDNDALLDIMFGTFNMRETDSVDRKYDGVKATFKKDDKWHMYCVTRDPGHTTVYIDGKRAGEKPLSYGNGIIRASYLLWGYQESPSLSFKGLITSFNVWNKVLTEEEISKMAGTCTDAIGDFLDWHTFGDFRGLLNFFTKTASKCQAPE